MSGRGNPARFNFEVRSLLIQVRALMLQVLLQLGHRLVLLRLLLESLFSDAR